MACPDWAVPRGLQTCFAGALCPLAPQEAPVLLRKVDVWHSCSLLQACGGHSNILHWGVIHRQLHSRSCLPCPPLPPRPGRWGVSIRSEPQHSSIFPISSCFLPHPPSTFVSSQPLSIPFFSSFPPGSSVCVKVHVRSVPTRFSPPTLVPLPCPELPKGDKCIEHPWPLCGRGQWAGDPAQPCRLLFLSLCVGKRTKKPRQHPPWGLCQYICGQVESNSASALPLLQTLWQVRELQQVLESQEGG